MWTLFGRLLTQRKVKLEDIAVERAGCRIESGGHATTKNDHPGFVQ
jgi:hypothetical protein